MYVHADESDGVPISRNNRTVDAQLPGDGEPDGTAQLATSRAMAVRRSIGVDGGHHGGPHRPNLLSQLGMRVRNRAAPRYVC